jgi:hypothetical protein
MNEADERPLSFNPMASLLDSREIQQKRRFIAGKEFLFDKADFPNPRTCSG